MEFHSHFTLIMVLSFMSILTIKRKSKTQWEHAVGQLGIDVIHANSPQAKGRVERCNQTMQDRLIKDMRIAKVSTMQEANNFLRTSNFINSHNALFSARSAQEGNAHRSIELYDLDAIFCIKTRRVLANDFTITYKNQIFQLHKHQRAFIRPKDEIVVSTLLDGSIRLSIRKIDLNFTGVPLSIAKVLYNWDKSLL
jgi:hypothetical protein